MILISEKTHYAILLVYKHGYD